MTVKYKYVPNTQTGKGDQVVDMSKVVPLDIGAVDGGELPPIAELRRYGVVLEPSGIPGSFDKTDVGMGDIVKIGSTYFMIYSGNSADVGQPRAWTIGLATSTDKKTWTRQGQILAKPAELGTIFANSVYYEDGVWYLMASGIYTSPVDGEKGSFRYYYTSDPTLMTWTYGGILRRNTDFGLIWSAGNECLVRGDDGYYYQTLSEIPDIDNKPWKARIRLIRSTVNTAFTDLGPSTWTKTWDGKEHILLDYDDPRWADTELSVTTFDSKVFKAGGMWLLHVGSCGWNDATVSTPFFKKPTSRIFYSKNIDGPYSTPLRPMYRTDGTVTNNPAGRSAHIVEDNTLESFVDMSFSDNKVRIVRFTNKYQHDNPELLPPTSGNLAMFGDRGIVDTGVSATDPQFSSLRLDTGANVNAGASLQNFSTADNLAVVSVYPFEGTNVGSVLDVVPKGTGFSSGIKSQISVFNTDVAADPANNEFMAMRAAGTRYEFQSQKAGTGTSVLPISFRMGGPVAMTVGPSGGLYVGNSSAIDPGEGVVQVATSVKYPDSTTQTTAAITPFTTKTTLNSGGHISGVQSWVLYKATSGGSNTATIDFGTTGTFAIEVESGTYTVTPGSGVSLNGGTTGITIGPHELCFFAAGSPDDWKMTRNGTVKSITPGTGFTSTTPITDSGTLNVDVGTGANQLPPIDSGGVFTLPGALATGALSTLGMSTTSRTNYGAAGVLLRTSTNATTGVTDGYGAGLTFQIAGTGLSATTIASVGAVRAGADNTGDVVIKPSAAGTLVEGIRAVNNKDVLLGNGAGAASGNLATTATAGFPYIPTMAGTPTGAPTSRTGLAPIVIDTTAPGKIWVDIGGTWTAWTAESFPMGEISMQDNATATTISVAGTFYKVAGTTSIGNNMEMDSNSTSNRLRYTGSATKMFHIAASLSVKSGGSNDIIKARVAKNGTTIASSTVTTKLMTAGDVTSTAIHTITSLATNDYLELFITNATDTDSVTVTDMNMFAMGVSH